MDLAFLSMPVALAGTGTTLLACFGAALLSLDSQRRVRGTEHVEYLRAEIARRTVERDATARELEDLREEMNDLRQEQAQLEIVRARREEQQARLDEVVSKLATLADDQRRLEEVRTKLAASLEEATTLERMLGQLGEEERTRREAVKTLGEKHAELERAVAEASSRCETVSAGLTRLTIERDRLAAEIEPLKAEAAALKSENDEARTILDAARQRRDRITSEIEAGDKRISGRLTELREIEQKISESTAMRSALAEEISGLENDRNSLRHEVTALGKVQAETAELRHRREALRAEVAELERKRDPGSEERIEAMLGDLLVAPEPLRRARQRLDLRDESAALDRVRTALEQQGLTFSPRLVNAFHTSLKISAISPMTVLAGISGTGKSELPRQYAAAMGLPFFLLAVQPRWDSPQDLFGFYNYLEHSYKPTELARLMIHLDARNWPDQAEAYREHMALVLLDEMNLARVEYYFSEFLSRLEVRRDRDDLKAAEIELELGRLPKERIKRVYPVRRLLFVGTMNEDESTQTLSDKVVDRANVMRFPKPTTLTAARDANGASGENDRFLPFGTWASWYRSEPVREIGEWLGTVNAQLEVLGRPFGHRMSQAISAYVANYPDSSQGVAAAFADQLEMRIFPKLRGIAPDDEENRTAFEKLESFIRNTIHDEKLANAFHEASQRDFFLWRGIERE